jgi:hypothetical protein
LARPRTIDTACGRWLTVTALHQRLFRQGRPSRMHLAATDGTQAHGSICWPAPWRRSRCSMSPPFLSGATSSSGQHAFEPGSANRFSGVVGAACAVWDGYIGRCGRPRSFRASRLQSPCWSPAKMTARLNSLRLDIQALSSRCRRTSAMRGINIIVWFALPCSSLTGHQGICNS